MEKLDAIIFGATGFTGGNTVFHAVEILKEFKWGIAGRNREKLEKVLKEIGQKSGKDLSKIPIFVADISDETSLKNMTSNARLIINCVGPYQFYGEQVIKACLETSTNYIDVSAEPCFMERMQLEYNETAQNKGVYMVSACGFDCVPAEMGIAYLQQQFGGTVNSVELYYRVYPTVKLPAFSATINYGTWESMIYNVASYGELKEVRRKLLKNKLPKMEPKLKNRLPIHIQSHVGNRVSAFYPGIDHSIVARSQRHFHKQDNQRPIQLQVYYAFSSAKQFFGLSWVGTTFLSFSFFKCGRSLLKKHPRFFSLGLISRDGPTELVEENTKFELTFIGKGWKGHETKGPINRKMVTRVTNKHTGYAVTCVAFLSAAKTILKEQDKMPGNGGVITPGVAFGKTNLISELTSNGFTFEVLEQKEK
jgi:short subunit dehydrogenase-like uncharacterized protein